MLRYEKKSLFDVTGNVILVHAVNCKGVMGSGIAKEFKQRFPEAFEMYAEDCKGFDDMLGKAVIYGTKKKEIAMGCLFTSNGYGKFVDPPNKILQSTESAISEFLHLAEESVEDFGARIYSNKFNSGLFNVPWEKTEALIVKALQVYPNIDWVVCDPQL